ncbi:MAG: acyltransferase family protein [Sphingomonas sp.]|nr:acyltransferase family protein [Sphingomonas sp.]
MQATDYVGGRRYGLDWLRIAAFGLLIVYHIGMFFVPWGWHVQTARPLDWAALPMLALNPWRLALLFLIAGIASRALLAKMGGQEGFARERSTRLLIPLIAGMALFVAPQAWVELREKSGYAAGFWSFWITDYFEFGASRGLILPTYNHLWFVAYLWVYTMALALLALVPARGRALMQKGFDRLFAGWRLIALPVLWLFVGRMLLYPAFGDTHALVDDLYAHSVYAFAFFFGVGLARSQALWERIVGWWKPAALAAIISYLGFAAFYVVHDILPSAAPSAWELAFARFARAVQAWSAILALLGMAQLFLHRDGPVRRYLTDAIFPYYIAHQTIIVLAGYWLKPFGLGPGMEFAILLVVTVACCALAYEIARRSAWARPLFGLKPAASRRLECVGEQPELLLPR